MVCSMSTADSAVSNIKFHAAAGADMKDEMCDGRARSQEPSASDCSNGTTNGGFKGGALPALFMLPALTLLSLSLERERL